ncbi:MAG: hypothetical protein OIF47_13990 [Marinibacterium sp.]|nr:hypothetical protein [Marinibacterium sp.]
MADTSTPSADAIHPLAPHYIPGFLPNADGSDSLFTICVVLLILILVAAGVFYLKLHSLPERMVHGASRAQFQIVAILGLIALVTHQNIYWIIALLLAAFTFPDFLTPITSGARSLAKLAGRDYEGDLDDDDDPHATPAATQSQGAV